MRAMVLEANEVDIGVEAYRENTYELRPGALSES